MRASYIALSEGFIEGIEEWFNKKGIEKENVVEVGAGMGELGKRLGLSVENVTDLRLSSKADDYDPLSNSCFKESDEDHYDQEDKDSVNGFGEGLDSVVTIGPSSDFVYEETETSDDIEYWELGIAYGNVEEAYKTVKKAKDIQLLIMAMPTHDKDEFAFHTATVLNERFKSARILYIGPSLDSEYISQVASPEFFKHCKEVEVDDDPDFHEHVVRTYPATISRFQSCLLGDDFARTIRPYLFEFQPCSCLDCKKVK